MELYIYIFYISCLAFEGQCILIQILHCFLPCAKTTLTTGQLHVGHILPVDLIEPFCGSGAVALQPPE